MSENVWRCPTELIKTLIKSRFSRVAALLYNLRHIINPSRMYCNTGLYTVVVCVPQPSVSGVKQCFSDQTGWSVVSPSCCSAVLHCESEPGQRGPGWTEPGQAGPGRASLAQPRVSAPFLSCSVMRCFLSCRGLFKPQALISPHADEAQGEGGATAALCLSVLTAPFVSLSYSHLSVGPDRRRALFCLRPPPAGCAGCVWIVRWNHRVWPRPGDKGFSFLIVQRCLPEDGSQVRLTLPQRHCTDIRFNLAKAPLYSSAVSRAPFEKNDGSRQSDRVGGGGVCTLDCVQRANAFKAQKDMLTCPHPSPQSPDKWLRVQAELFSPPSRVKVLFCAELALSVAKQTSSTDRFSITQVLHLLLCFF